MNKFEAQRVLNNLPKVKRLECVVASIWTYGNLIPEPVLLNTTCAGFVYYMCCKYFLHFSFSILTLSMVSFNV